MIKNNLLIYHYEYKGNNSPYISIFGLLLMFVFVGYILQVYIFSFKTKSTAIQGISLSYLIIVQIISLFIGNLLIISFSNTLITLLFEVFFSISLMVLKIHV